MKDVWFGGVVVALAVVASVAIVYYPDAMTVVVVAAVLLPVVYVAGRQVVRRIQTSSVPPSKVLSRFPTTTVLALTYGPLVVLPGLSNGTLGPSLGVVALGMLAVLTVEVFMARLRVRVPTTVPYTMRAISFITWVGVAATVISAAGGARNFEAQIEGRSRTFLASLTTPLVPWVVIGLAFALLAYKAGEAPKRQVARLFTASIGVCLVTAFYNGILAPAALILTPLAFLAVLIRLMRFRTLFLLLLVAVLLWPTVHHYRNQTRINAGVSEAQLSTSPLERFNLDRQLALLDEYGKRDVDAPSLPDVIRYGLVPSAIDPGRPPLLIGQNINRAYGGQGRSATSLTLFGNVYIAAGWQGVVLFGAVMAFALRFLLRRSATSVVVAVLVIQRVLAIDATYPVSIAGLLQQLVSLAAALLALRLFRRHRARKPAAVYATS